MIPPDLLHPEPRRRLDTRALDQTLVFAFASGGHRDALDRIALRGELEPSLFSPDCFAKDLFLADFVTRCTGFAIEGRRYQPQAARLARLLSHPPADPQVSAFRQEILRELFASTDLHSALQRSFVRLREVFSLLESADSGKHFDPVARRLEILRAVLRAIDELCDGFSAARSGLQRISAYASRLRSSAAYENLRQLLDHEGHLATVQVRLTLAYDGQLRGFEIVRAEENVENRFYVSPIGRLLTRLRLLFRGYHVRHSEVLGRLINGVFDGVSPFVADAVELLGALEFYLAALGFAELARAQGLEVCLPEFEPPEAARDPASELDGLFNPFLLLEDRPPVPCDIRIAGAGFVIVTGPNSGGKTRLLQAMGLAQLLAQ
ncbi:MAG TPA: DNA mismatch repair protein, partial [Polyangiaceae bacterium]|nr:DNA mismatch repair protein [Polyangiaceae bacterium]